MGNTSFERKSCCLCAAALAAPAFVLTPTPPANAFVKEPTVQECFPLEVCVCPSCGHSQLRHILPPEELFRNYVYVSGTSPSFVQHFEEYAQLVSSDMSLKEGDVVVDVGGNDGTLLKAFGEKTKKLTLINVEPATAIAVASSRATGCIAYPEFFTMEVAKKLKANHGPAKVITANNVFAHSMDLGAFVEAVRELLAPQGAFIFEVQNVASLLNSGLFDMVYHEHTSYHSATPLVEFFGQHGMKLFGVTTLYTHGGSLRFRACRADSPPGNGKANFRYKTKLESLLFREKTLGFGGPAIQAHWEKLAAKVNEAKAKFHVILDEQIGKNELVGFGAPAKATTLLYHFGVPPNALRYIVDDSPLKQGLYTPGMHIPVVPAETLYSTDRGYPDFVFILAWNFAKEIVAKHDELKYLGTKFVTPLPKCEVL